MWLSCMVVFGLCLVLFDLCLVWGLPQSPCDHTRTDPALMTNCMPQRSREFSRQSARKSGELHTHKGAIAPGNKLYLMGTMCHNLRIFDNISLHILY